MDATDTPKTAIKKNAGITGQPGISSPSLSFNRTSPTTVNVVPMPNVKPMYLARSGKLGTQSITNAIVSCRITELVAGGV